jgi:hypothetical protein
VLFYGERYFPAGAVEEEKKAQTLCCCFEAGRLRLGLFRN